jgi:hypothetical protein
LRRVVPAPDRHGHNRTGGKTQDNGLPNTHACKLRVILEIACHTTEKEFSTVSGELTDSGQIRVILAE